MIAESQDWQKLVEYVEAKIGPPPLGRDHFTPETDLYHDLDLNPAAIAALLDEWATTFGVDMSEFGIEHYYPLTKLGKPALFWTLLKSPFSRNARETLGGWQLTLGMLEEAMTRGKWVID